MKKDEEYKGCFNDVFEALGENGEKDDDFSTYNEEMQQEITRKENFKKASFGEKLCFVFLKSLCYIFTLQFLPLGISRANRSSKKFEERYNMKMTANWFFVSFLCYLASLLLAALLVTLIALIIGVI